MQFSKSKYERKVGRFAKYNDFEKQSNLLLENPFLLRHFVIVCSMSIVQSTEGGKVTGQKWERAVTINQGRGQIYKALILQKIQKKF